MRVLEFLGIEVFALLVFAWFVLAIIGRRKRNRKTERAIFVGGPLDNTEKQLIELPPAYYEKVGRGKYAVYTHDSYGVYTFVDYVTSVNG